MKPILEIKNISKKYNIRHENAPQYDSLRDTLTNGFKNIFKKNSQNKEVFYALNDISFEVLAGESVGIIGKNGAGKSTLLKILSQITPPSSGEIITRGRIASLLEVGTGFHQELSGRENIFLNGSILGLKRAEINKHFDAIVDFSGVEKFLDTPLKHYSSGMQLRLAFAVAAHLEPEILIIDEVLAVGDAEFQKKCMGKMNEVSNSGRTVLFVSHNMGVINELCQKCIVLENGKIIFNGNSSEATDIYLSKNLSTSGKFQITEELLNKKTACITHVEICNQESISQEIFKVDETIKIKLRFKLETFTKGIEFAIAIYNNRQIKVGTIHETLIENQSEYELSFSPNQLLPGKYFVTTALHIPHQVLYHLEESVVSFDIANVNHKLTDYENQDIGVIKLNYEVTK
ncbi:MAG: ABC transporter ATP-binding protein [Cytophagales bacterium]